MKRYRRIEDILVFQWKGDFSIVKEINDAVKSFNETSDYSVKVRMSFDDDECLMIYNCHEYGTLGLVVEMNNYIVFDAIETQMPLDSYSEKSFNDKFILI